MEGKNEAVLNETIKLFSKVKLYGLGYMEMKYDKKSKNYYIIEPNIGRPTGRSSIAEGGGVELLFTMYCDVLGQTLPANREQKFIGVKWIDITRDCASAYHYWRSGSLTFGEWIKSLRGRKVYAVFSWSDPLPFLGAILKGLKSPRGISYLFPFLKRKS